MVFVTCHVETPAGTQRGEILIGVLAGWLLPGQCTVWISWYRPLLVAILSCRDTVCCNDNIRHYPGRCGVTLESGVAISGHFARMTCEHVLVLWSSPPSPPSSRYMTTFCCIFLIRKCKFFERFCVFTSTKLPRMKHWAVCRAGAGPQLGANSKEKLCWSPLSSRYGGSQFIRNCISRVLGWL